MKNLIYLIIILTVITTSCKCVKLLKKIPSVDVKLQPHFNKLDSIYTSKGININYRKIKEIKVMDTLNSKKYEGLYNKKTKTVYININQDFAKKRGVYGEVITIILAHEIAHSQEIHHTNDPRSIMFRNSFFMFKLLEIYPLDYLVSSMYIKNK